MVIPNLHHCLPYELYDMNSNIGFKVENTCLLLFQNRSLKVVIQDELTKDSVKMYLTGNILFEKAFQAFENDHTISVLQSLQSQIPQTRKFASI